MPRFMFPEQKALKNAKEEYNIAKSKNPREIELVILKNRNGQTGAKVPFEFYPMFNYFVEDDNPQYILADSESETTKPQTLGDAYDVIPVEGSDLVEIKRREIE